MEIVSTVDNVKKGRMLTLAAVISVLMIGIKITKFGDDVSSLSIISRCIAFFVMAYCGLIWALRFQVSKSSLLSILPQSSFYVFTQYLFVEYFFSRGVERIYEFIILFIVLILIFIGVYASFLMANIFNVATIKQIPLENVGRTVSYILSLLSVYFLTYGLFESSLSWYFLLLLFALGFFIVSFFHFKRLDMSKERIGRITLLSFLTLIVTISGAIVVSSRHEYIASVPVVVLFSISSIVMKKENEEHNTVEYKYFLLVLIIFMLNFFGK